METQGALLVVGTGIRAASQLTREAERAIRSADKVLFAVADPWAVEAIRALRPDAESLRYPRSGKLRRQIYAEMVEQIVAEVLAGQNVCAVFYGHPGVFADAPHRAVRRVLEAGHVAKMCPAVSFLDCLFADLGVDPATQGCTILEANDLLSRPRGLDPHVPLVLCQIGQIGNPAAFDAADKDRIGAGLERLSDTLCHIWPAAHEVVVYEAACAVGAAPSKERVALSALRTAAVSSLSSLWVPALPLPGTSATRIPRPAPSAAS